MSKPIGTMTPEEQEQRRAYWRQRNARQKNRVVEREEQANREFIEASRPGGYTAFLKSPEYAELRSMGSGKS